jgi:hypothetical protein
VLHILTHQSFDIVKLLLDEIEDVSTDGMGLPDSYCTTTGSAIFAHGLRQMRRLLLLTMMSRKSTAFPPIGRQCLRILGEAVTC